MFRAITAVASVSVGVVAAVIGKTCAEKNKLDEELKENNAECDEWFIDADFLPAADGDLIEIQRDGYAHWAVYVGDGNVIHLTQIGDGKAKVFMQELKVVARDSVCRINNLELEAQRQGLIPRNINDIIDAAYEELGKISDYHLFNNNCEHFATYCRFGMAFSQQGVAANGQPIIRNVAPLFARSKHQYD